jgi:hypothetical protein
MVDKNSPTDSWSLETVREKQKIQQWQLRMRHSAQTALRKSSERRN